MPMYNGVCILLKVDILREGMYAIEELYNSVCQSKQRTSSVHSLATKLPLLLNSMKENPEQQSGP